VRIAYRNYIDDSNVPLLRPTSTATVVSVVNLGGGKYDVLGADPDVVVQYRCTA
jgi:hypothetical protein